MDAAYYALQARAFLENGHLAYNDPGTPDMQPRDDPNRPTRGDQHDRPRHD